MQHSRLIANQELQPIPDRRNWPIWPWALLGIFALIDGLWLLATPIALDANAVGTIFSLMPLVVAALLGAKRFEDNDAIYVVCTGLAFILVAWPTLRLFNHLSMTTALPWADATLSQLDSMIRFDWHAYIRWLDGQRWLLSIMNWTYTGLNGYSIFFFLLLALFPDRRAACFEFIALFVVSASLCMTLGMFFPAQAAMVYYAPDLAGFQHVHDSLGTYHISSLNMLREAPAPVLELDSLPGLVTFPSFHTAMGVVLIYACRRSLFLLVPSLGINLSMIAATPLYGSHYGIDILGGIVAALATIAIIRHLERRASDATDWVSQLGFARLKAPAA
ncbi:phosphatase PAP2 family protein [Parasphingopyxis lamellibrachiae]|uniref:PAP2 superfamily protein n=1 Tax=Parasphingopyxis lamellibrachiae TaxID=680125 RepID=A0A3D9FJI1_9SPHN|nr:phosphatase PAP2 family protein [Parasphingopyxis lamellibrachiae]RED17747.1 PAP2 superfamily protein [Parasphingopyxis lamellibrachiae]